MKKSSPFYSIASFEYYSSTQNPNEIHANEMLKGKERKKTYKIKFYIKRMVRAIRQQNSTSFHMLLNTWICILNNIKFIRMFWMLYVLIVHAHAHAWNEWFSSVFHSAYSKDIPFLRTEYEQSAIGIYVVLDSFVATQLCCS